MVGSKGVQGAEGAEGLMELDMFFINDLKLFQRFWMATLRFAQWGCSHLIQLDHPQAFARPGVGSAGARSYLAGLRNALLEACASMRGADTQKKRLREAHSGCRGPVLSGTRLIRGSCVLIRRVAWRERTRLRRVAGAQRSRRNLRGLAKPPKPPWRWATGDTHLLRRHKRSITNGHEDKS